MADNEDNSAVLRRLEAALNRIAAQVAKPRPISAIEASATEGNPERAALAADSLDIPVRHEVVTKLDDLINGLRNALGVERHP